MSSPRMRLSVVIVHYSSGGMLVDLLQDLTAQQGVDLDVHIVEAGGDGSVEEAVQRFPLVTVHRPGRNVGYAAGNNIGFRMVEPDDPVLVVNPDVRIESPTAVLALASALHRSPQAAAVAPVIVGEDGRLEYLDSVVDRRRARAVHTHTHVPSRASAESARSISWLDGACLLFRSAALHDVGGFDERYFLIVEEVDWCLRATDRGWTLLLVRDAQISHQRSSSFGGSVKSAYYSARNEYLLFRTHGRGLWRWHWAMKWLRICLGSDHRRSGKSQAAALGAWHGLTGRWGPGPEDKPERATIGQ